MTSIYVARGSLLSLLCISTWVLPYLNFEPNFPSWTISTIFFWYWGFPLILPRMQSLTDKQLAYGIVRYFWLQVGVALVVVIGFLVVDAFVSGFLVEKFVSYLINPFI